MKIPIEGEYEVLRCPCGGGNLHHQLVEIEVREEDEDGDRVRVYQDGTFSSEKVRAAHFRGRRAAIAINFFCESCGYVNTLVLQQHKGETQVWWEMGREEPEGQAERRISFDLL